MWTIRYRINGMISCGRKCSGQLKFSSELYISTNRAFLSLKSLQQKKFMQNQNMAVENFIFRTKN